MRQPSSVQTDEAQAGRADTSTGRTRGLARRLRAFAAAGGWGPPAAQETARFVPLRAVGALDSLVERSHAQPVIVFQHDPFCPISRRAQRELAGLPIEAALVDVARDGAVSRMLEQRTGVPHESPQVLVFRAGRVAWTASHFGITRGALARALQLGSTPPS